LDLWRDAFDWLRQIKRLKGAGGITAENDDLALGFVPAGLLVCLTRSPMERATPAGEAGIHRCLEVVSRLAPAELA
jgi:hypothetical protein